MATDSQQLAQQLLRSWRKEGMTFSVERTAGEEPTLRVGPKEKISLFHKMSIPRVKAELIHAIEHEDMAYSLGEDGRVWNQRLARCEVCNACDWGIIGTTSDKWGEMNVWGCLTCRADGEQLKDDMERFAHKTGILKKTRKAK